MISILISFEFCTLFKYYSLFSFKNYSRLFIFLFNSSFVILNFSRLESSNISWYDPLLPYLAALPLIYTSSDSSSEKKVWITCIPPFFRTFSSLSSKSVPLPYSRGSNVIYPILEALQIIDNFSFFVAYSCI